MAHAVQTEGASTRRMRRASAFSPSRRTVCWLVLIRSSISGTHMGEGGAACTDAAGCGYTACTQPVGCHTTYVRQGAGGGERRGLPLWEAPRQLPPFRFGLLFSYLPRDARPRAAQRGLTMARAWGTCWAGSEDAIGEGQDGRASPPRVVHAAAAVEAVAAAATVGGGGGGRGCSETGAGRSDTGGDWWRLSTEAH